MKYYIYFHIRLDTNQLFYIGKGTKCSKGNIYKRAYTKNGRNRYWLNITNKTSYRVDIVEEFENEDRCLEREIELIKKYGFSWNNTGILCNIVEDASKSVLLGIRNSIKVNSKLTYQYDKYGNYINEYKSMTEASKATNILVCDISACVNNNKYLAGGFQWKNYKVDFYR